MEKGGGKGCPSLKWEWVESDAGLVLSGQNCLVTCVLNLMLRFKDISAVTKIEAMWEV